MPVIVIREERQTDTGFEAILKFDSGEYRVTITDPFTPQEEKHLEWYFEDWITFPFGDTAIAEKTAASVKTYGERLFKQVFQTDINAYSIYCQLRSKLSEVQIEIIGNNPEFQALHWEALHDPEWTRPLAVDCVMLRKSVKPAPVSANVQISPVINLLVVVARPDEEKDVAYRTISRPLLELIENSHLRVNVELLRPGTYEALSQHLEEKGAGFYHVIHLDMHGALMTYEQVDNPSKRNRYVYKGRYGRGDLQPFEGVKAFLAFEGETQGRVDLVEAGELAALLTGKGIPVCILNACQSGKQVRNSLAAGEAEAKENEATKGEGLRETSLGSRLMTAGMQMVVAMGYSVTVSAATLLMEQIYRHLFNNKPITEAIRLGRRELFNNKERKAYHNKFISLEDWLLPVVYYSQVVNFNLRQFTPEEEEKYWEFVGSQYRFILPEYGFIGRDLEILKIEKALLKHNILLLQGMGGTGKTTLLNYLRTWWQKTHFVRDVFYFGYDERAWTLEQILHEIGNLVYNRFEQAKFQAMKQPAQVQKLVATLRTENYALILDNLESVTGQQLAIQNTLPEVERNQIRDFLGLLVGGATRVVLGSRSREEWLQKATFRTNVYELQGLDREARTELAEKILERNVPAHRLAAIPQDTDFQKLMKLLAGYPLAMEVVLANLRHQSPQKILEALQGGDVDLDAKSDDKTKSILKCVEYSHSNLSPEAQKLLLCLAPFSGFIDRTDIPNYAKQLQQLEAFQNYDFAKFNDAIQEAINWGLLSPMDEENRLLTIQPIFPYFLQSKLDVVDSSTREDLREGFKNHYISLARSYNRLMNSKDAEERQLGILFCRLEYENLYNALQICLEKQETIDIFFCLDKYFELINDIQSNLKLAEQVYQAIDKYPSEFLQTENGYDIVIATDLLANCYLQTQQYQQAKQLYEKKLEVIDKLTNLELRRKKISIATTYHQLGRVAEELRQWEQAKSYYQQALDIKIEYGDRYSQASTYHQLGSVAQQLRQWEQAKSYYQQALDIKIEYGDRYSQASTYHQLGSVAEELRQWEQAKSYYQQALDILIEYGDRYSQASTYHQLGSVAQELRQWEQAKSYYQQALDILIEYGDRYSQARSYHQLGSVAQQLRQWEQAKSYYQQALDIKIEYGDRYSQARSYHQLGRVAEELRQWEQAKTYYQQALDILIEYGDRYSQARSYYQLGRVAEELGEIAQATAYYLQDLQITFEFNDEHGLSISVRNFVRFYQATQDESLLQGAANVFGVTVEEVRGMIERALE